MKAKLILVALIAIFTSLSGQNDGDKLFDDSFLHEIRFTSVDTLTYIRTKDYQQSDMTIDGMAVTGIGFKRKGNISGYPSTNKFPIKVKTNKYISGTEYDGIKEFTLHMNYEDPTMLREKLTYEICAEMRLYSLRTAFAKVYIDNIYWGLFTIVEGKDEMYKQVFGDRDMDAIESLDLGNMCFRSNNPTDYDTDRNGGLPTYQLENGDGATAWPRFVQMIDKVNNTPDNQYVDTASKYLNLEDFFRYQAINVYLMNFDSYIAFQGNQIYVYDTTANIWQVTPWDFNASFGLWNTNNEVPNMYPMIPGAITNGCIASKMNNLPALKKYYLDAMCELNLRIGDTARYFDRIDFLKNQIQQAVYDDTRKVITNADFDNGTEYGFFNLFNENQPALKTFVKERSAIVKQGLMDEGYLCKSMSISTDASINRLKVYPNPAKNSIRISIPNRNLQAQTLTIFNAKGQSIITTSAADKSVDINHLESGIYYIKLEYEGNIWTQKFMKE